MATIQQVYIALYGRPADPGGLAYWNEVTDNGENLAPMIAAFTDTDEFRNRYEGQDSEEIITSIYLSLFGREPDAEGLAFYTEALEDGTLALESIAINILDGAQETDAVIIENKTETANLFTSSLDSPEEIEGYVGSEAAGEAGDFLSTITEDPASVPSEDEIDEIIEQVTSGNYPDPGQEPPDDGDDETPPGDGGEGSVTLLDANNEIVASFDSLQAAIDNAATIEGGAAGYTVVANGEVESTEDIVIDVAGLTVQGDGQTISGGVHFLANADGATLEGFNVTGTLDGSTLEGASVFVRAPNVTIVDTDISSSEADANSGIVTAHGLADLTVDGGVISGFDGYGIYLNTPEGHSVTGVTFEDNRYGVLFQDGTAPVITGNTFSNSEVADIGAYALRGTGELSLTPISDNTHDGTGDSVRVLSSGGHAVVGTSGDDVFVELAAGNDVFDGGTGADTMTGGSGTNTLISSAGGDTYIATEGEVINFKLSDTAHSGFGEADITTFDFSEVTVGGEARIPLNILISGEDFAGASVLLDEDPTVGAFGIGRDAGHSAEDFFFLGDGEEAALTPGADYTPTPGDQSLVVYERLDEGDDHYMVYFDADGNGDLGAGDAQIEIIGLNHADVSWGSGAVPT